MFTRISETVSRSLSGDWELRTVGDTVEVWRRAPDWRRVAVVEQPTIDRVQTAILRAGQVH